VRRRNPVADLVLFAACRAVLFVLALLPRAAGLRLGRVVGVLAYWTYPARRRIALANIRRAYGAALDDRARARLARASFAHLGSICADAAYFPRLLREPTERLAVHQGAEHLRAAIAEGRGVLVFSGHLGHWEMIGLLQPRLGIPFTMVVRPLENARIDGMLARLRRRAGNTLIPKRDAARGVLRALREGRAIALLIDQNVREGGLFVNFFGVPASTTPALATFALKCGSPIVPVFCSRVPDGRALIRYLPALHPVRRGPLDDDIRDLTRACTALIEEEVRRRPEEWFWMHDRWRTRPAPAGPAPAAAARTEDGAPARAIP
jgi:KDO2-lipid IV(A) lauroyltransferase